MTEFTHGTILLIILYGVVMFYAGYKEGRVSEEIEEEEKRQEEGIDGRNEEV